MALFSLRDKKGRPLPWKWAGLLLLNLILSFGIYCYFVMARNINWIFWLYYAALAALSLAYVVYNRGFVAHGKTAADLPTEWGYEKKTAFLAERDRRLRNSKWMLTLIVPLCLTVLFDVIYLFYGEALVKMLGDTLDFLT